MNPIRVIIAGGGTGGHFYPALAIARKLTTVLSPDSCEITFIGTKRGIEYKKRDSLEFPIKFINVRGIVRSLSFKNLLFPFALIGALLKTDAIIQSIQPDLVIGTGGYVSAPAISRALSRKIPCAIQEQNSFPGLTTRHYANKVDRVYLGFGEALSHLKPGVKAVNTGNPVRDEIGLPSREEGLAHFQLSSSKKTILILGGSQGSRSINNSVLKDFENLSSECQLIWQTGQSDFESIREKVGDRMEGGTLFAFHDRIELAYAAADIAIARAGALTVAELLVSETPALLAPYPHAAGDHQTKNAQMSLTRGVAEIVEDRNLNSENLIDKACQIAQSSKCVEMREAIRKWNYERPPHASETICRDLVKLLRERGKLS